MTEENVERVISQMPQQQKDVTARMKTLRLKSEQSVAYTLLCHAIRLYKDSITSDSLWVREVRIKELNDIEPLSNPPHFEYGEHGKPYLSNYDSIFFNISHCREAVVVGVSNRETGIDVEGRRTFSDTLLKRAFSEEERAKVNNALDPQLEFSRLWTRKEAWFKWTGTGILLDHIHSTEADARMAGCTITTIGVITTAGRQFFLSIAQ